jgi:hypothetical protein
MNEIYQGITKHDPLIFYFYHVHVFNKTMHHFDCRAKEHLADHGKHSNATAPTAGL